MARPASDALLLLALGLLWGSAFIVIRAGLLAGASPLLFAALRFPVAAAVMAAVALAVGERRPSLGSLGLPVLIGATCLMGGYSLLLYWGEQFTAGGLASVMIATAPILSAVFAAILLPADRFGIAGAVGIALGFAGVALLFLPDLTSGPAPPVDALAAEFGAALLFSIGSVVLRRLKRSSEGYWSISAQLGGAGLLFVPVLLLTAPTEHFPITAVTVAELLYLGVGSSAIGFILYFALHHRVGPSRANLVAYVNPAVGLAIGLLWLGEIPSTAELIGLALIVGGLAMLQIDRSRR